MTTKRKTKLKCRKCNHDIHPKGDCNQKANDAAGDLDWCPCQEGFDRRVKPRSKYTASVFQAPEVSGLPTLAERNASYALITAYKAFLQLPQIHENLAKDHLGKTPFRVVKALFELVSGYKQDPVEILKTGFGRGTYNEMITIGSIGFHSLCAHHLLSFSGKVHFAYIPNKTIVGLSKIPRMIEALSRRLQVQEELSEQIVGCFQETVKPKGCAVLIEATHLCCGARGIRKEGVVMRTTALRGIFERDASAKAEFLAGVNGRK